MVTYIVEYIDKAKNLVKEFNNEFITPEHVLYAILGENNEVSNMFAAYGIDTESIMDSLYGYFEDNRLDEDIDVDITCSSCLVDAIDKCDEDFKKSGFSALIMFAEELYNSGSEFIKNLLDAYDVFLGDMVNDIRSIINVEEDTEVGTDKAGVGKSGKAEVGKASSKEDARDKEYERFKRSLPNFVSWIEDADDLYGSSEYLVPRDNYLMKMEVYIRKLEKAHICLYGKDGVGKKTLIHQLLKHCEGKAYMMELDMGAVLGNQQLYTNVGTVFDSVKGAIDKINSLSKGDKIGIIYIKNFKCIMGYKSLIESVASSLIDLELYSTISVVFELDKSDALSLKDISIFNSRVNFLEVTDMDEDEINRALELKTEFIMNTRCPNIRESGYKKAVELARKYLKDENILDAVASLVDEVAISYNDKLFNLEDKAEKEKFALTGVNDKFVEEVFNKLYSSNEKVVSMKEEGERLKTLKDSLKSEVFGQDKAIDEIVKHVELSKAGLCEENKPIGSFMFVGPTGTGKTQLARSLAKNLGVKLIKYDMSEFSEHHSISKMVGSPQGYIGYEEGGSLVRQISENPKAVLLLDEIEKAHPAVYNILLQIMDDAVLTDGKHQKADFKDVILIMTSNAGASDSQKRGIGFGNENFNSDNMSKALADSFAPEFRGRLSSIVEFNPLSKEIYADIVNKELGKISSRIYDKRKVNVKYTDDVVEFICNNVDTSKSGARDIESYIKDNVSTLLGHTIISEDIGENNSILLKVENNLLSLEY